MWGRESLLWLIHRSEVSRMRTIRQFFCSSSLVVLTMGCSSMSAPEALNVAIQQDGGTCSASGCPFVIQISNKSARPVLVSETVAIEGFYIFLDIRKAGGEKEKLHYPLPEMDFWDSPEAFCLSSGESVEVTVDLASWTPLWEGSETGELYSFPLSHSDYQIRGGYRAFHSDRGKLGCRVPRGSVESEWISFTYE